MLAAEPISYTIRLAPDLEALTFTGSVDIEMTLLKIGAPVVLDSVELEIAECSVTAGGAELESSFAVDDSSVSITCPAAAPGRMTVSLTFIGKLSDGLIGFYDAPYNDAGRVKHLAVTQFEEDHARRAFPCFDHPRYNTPFSVFLQAPEGAIALATTAVESEEELDGGGRLYEFRTTPPMPTYLLFFGVGDFECYEDRSFKVPIRVAATPGKAVQGKRAIEVAKASIAFCEKFTGIDYPLDKLDLIALPAFAFGAMENFGAITYREHLLLFDPAAASRRGFEKNALITAHETAHMWFGDITSPLAWRFVWLNEAFASYVEYLICEESFPEWRANDTFIFAGFTTAAARDSLIDTIPIELPDGCALEVDASTAPIFYQKSSLILRMVHTWLGEEKFTAGVRSYLSGFIFQSTDTKGFLDTFAAGAGAEASKIIANWIQQPGFPVVTAERDGTTLKLTQSRFTLLPNESDQIWHIPVSLLLFDEDGKSKSVGLILDKKSATLEIPKEVVTIKVNADHAGFFHTSYTPEEGARLGVLARDGILGDKDRYGLVVDLSAFVLSGEYSVDEFIGFLLDYYPGERSYLPLSGIGVALRTLWRYLPAAGREFISETGRKIFEPVYEEIGIAPSDDEAYLNVLLRDEVVWSLLLYGSPSVKDELQNRFRGFLAGESVEADLLQSSLCAGTMSDDTVFDELCGVIEDSKKPMALKVSAYEAIGWFQSPEVLSRVLAYTDESIEAQNRIYVYRAIADNPAADELLYDWLKKNLPSLETAHPYLSSVVLAAFIPFCEIDEEAKLDVLLRVYSNAGPSLSGVISMARERRRVFRSLRNLVS
jgi:aminopeptidase N